MTSSPASLTSQLKDLEEGDKIEVNSLDETLTVQEIRPRVHYEVVLEDSEGVQYSLMPHLVRDDVLTAEPSTPLSDQLIVNEIEVVE